MATIGHFRKAGSGFEGSIITLSVQHSAVRFVEASDQRGENAPNYWIYAGEAEVGAAWCKQGQNGRHYLSCKIDDPSFVAPIYPQLFEGEDGRFALSWTRSNR